MSYDLLFVSAPADGDWDGAIAAVEEQAASEQALMPQDLEVWGSLEAHVRTVLPCVTVLASEQCIELSDEGTGIQLSMFHGELALSVPDWHRGPEAQSLVAVLRRVVEIAERASGLVGYDPQAKKPFLEVDTAAVASAFDLIQERMGEVPSRSPGNGPPQAPERSGLLDPPAVGETAAPG